MKQEFYTLKNIFKVAPDAKYYVIYGQRSNGKTFSVLEYALDNYLKTGKQLGIIRRFKEDFNGGNASVMFRNLVSNEIRGNIVEKMSDGEWNNIFYYRGCWYLEHLDEDGKQDKKDPNPLAYRFALTDEEHDKSTAYPQITTILFDEFITRGYYLPNEFIKFMNVLSTIIRLRDDVRIFMCGNSIDKYSPYFAEMGLNKVKVQKKGTIDIYKYGESSLQVAVEYSDFPMKKKKSDVYFSFDNPSLKMITTGEWEISLYPHCPVDYYPTDIIYQYFIDFDGELLHCEVIDKVIEKGNGDTESLIFTFVHRKTTPIKDDGISMIYRKDYNPKGNHARKLTNPSNNLQKKLWWFYQADKVYYQDNSVGETMRSYLNWCHTEK